MDTSNRHPFLRTTIATALLLITVSGTDATAQDEAVRLNKSTEDDARNAAESTFRQIVFGERSVDSIDDIQTQLHQILVTRIEKIDRSCGLSDAQKEKLELAGRGSIRQLFQSIDALKHKYMLESLNDRKNAFRFLVQEREFGTFQLKFQSGPFGEDSLFAKTLRTILAPEQLDYFDQRSKLAAKSAKPITADNAVELVRISKVEKDVDRIVWNRDGTRLALVDFNNVEVYEPPCDQIARIFQRGKRVVGFDFNSDANIVAIVENSKIATIMDVNFGTELEIETNQAQPTVNFSRDGKLLATGGYGTQTKLWSTKTGELVGEIDVDPIDGLLTSVFSPDGRILAVGHSNSKTRLFDVETGKILHQLPCSRSHGLSFDPSGNTLAEIYVTGHLCLWDVKTGKRMNEVKSLGKSLSTVDWSPDGSLVVTGGLYSHVTLWRAMDLSIAAALESPESVNCVKFTPDGTKLQFAGGGRAHQTNRCVETWAVP